MYDAIGIGYFRYGFCVCPLGDFKRTPWFAECKLSAHDEARSRLVFFEQKGLKARDAVTID